MDVSYKKDGMNSYMIIKCDELFDNDYRLQMVMNNNIEGLLEIKWKEVNNQNQFYYDITAKHAMKNVFLKQKITANELEKLVIALANVAKSMKEYLLDINHIVLDMEFIYWNPKKNSFHFCYYPKNEVKMKDGLKNLFSEILKLLDHRDRRSVVMGYGMQQLTLSENVTITDIVEFLTENRDTYNEKEYTYEKIDVDMQQLKEEDVQQISDEIEFDEEEEEGEWETRNRKKIKKKQSEKKKKEIGEQQKKWWKFWKKREPKRKGELSGHLNVERELWKQESEKIEFTGNKLEYDTGMLNWKEEVDEEATILLASNVQAAGIVLRSTDIENPIAIIPNGFPCIIGKSMKSADCKLDEQFISRVHARIYEETEGYYIEDLNSSNGTFLNGVKISPHTQEIFKIGDKITLANIEFVVE